MTQSPLSTDVLCRPAVEGDRADVFEFCKGIWEEDDYVPSVWDDWIQDASGLLAVAELDGRTIGCSKITRISQGQWWLEGFRVDPRYQGRKVGTHLHHYVTNWWLENGDGILRLMTDAGNFAVHHLCHRTGFTKVGEVCAYRASSLDGPTSSFIPVSEPGKAADFAMQSESIKSTGGLVDLGWRICQPDQQVFENYTNQNSEYIHTFYWWQEHQGLFSTWEEEEEGKRTLFLGLVACKLSDLTGLLARLYPNKTREKA